MGAFFMLRHSEWRRCQKLIAQNCLTNSKNPRSHVFGVYPTHQKKAKGAEIWDMEGNRYLDYICGLGTNILGYGHEKVGRALAEQAFYGVSPSLASPVENDVAEQLKTFFPRMRKFKFLKTGTEACMAAIRIARAWQGVTHDNSSLHEMWAKEAFSRLSSEEFRNWQTYQSMQGLCEGLSPNAEGSGNQEIGATALRENPEREGNRAEAFSETAGKDKRPWPGQDLYYGPEGKRPWSDQSAAVQELWRAENQRASSRLQQAAGRDLALREMSRQGTSRYLILSDGYHGHSDPFISMTAPAAGVPFHDGILQLTGNEDLIPVAAAVIVEPVITDWSDKRVEYLLNLQEKCKQYGTVLIFDEVITGFRFLRGSVHEAFNLDPDLVVIGKAMANGMPLTAVMSSNEKMMDNPDYFVSSTYAGDQMSLRACKETVRILKSDPDFMPDNVWTQGNEFLEQFNDIQPNLLSIRGYPTRGAFHGDYLTKALFFQEMCLSGVLFCNSWFFNGPLSHFTKEVINLSRAVLTKISTGSVQLKGELPQSPFAMKVRKE